jgi:hypothetical protein
MSADVAHCARRRRESKMAPLVPAPRIAPARAFCQLLTTLRHSHCPHAISTGLQQHTVRYHAASMLALRPRSPAAHAETRAVPTPSRDCSSPPSDFVSNTPYVLMCPGQQLQRWLCSRSSSGAYRPETCSSRPERTKLLRPTVCLEFKWHCRGSGQSSWRVSKPRNNYAPTIRRLQLHCASEVACHHRKYKV